LCIELQRLELPAHDLPDVMNEMEREKDRIMIMIMIILACLPPDESLQ
jgi:hypothetical protein